MKKKMPDYVWLIMSFQSACMAYSTHGIAGTILAITFLLLYILW